MLIGTQRVKEIPVIGNWARENPCYTIAKNLDEFCLCPETL
jgi:hypothetical protein